MTDKIKVAHVTIRNILGIEELEFAPGGFTEVSGGNGSGKTSTIEALRAALRGGHDASLLRQGAEKGEIVLVLDDGTQIRKSITPDKTDVKILRDEKLLSKPASAIAARRRMKARARLAGPLEQLVRGRAMESPYTLPEGNVQIAFSGGRSSAYMLHEILAANGGLPDRAVVSFQNTGREMPETLDFVQECGERWGVPIVWIEFRAEPPHYAVVDHGSASRNGEPFEALIRKRKFLPNQQARFCSTELKIRSVKRYLVDRGWTHWTTATGLRADEPRRLNKAPPKERWKPWSPMAAAGVGKLDVMRFWQGQPFDLRLPNQNGKTPLGNCDGCFLKSEAIQANLAANYPERHAWWERMETLARSLTSGSGGTFSSRYSRKEMREFMENQGALALETEGALCQQDDGECFG